MENDVTSTDYSTHVVRFKGINHRVKEHGDGVGMSRKGQESARYVEMPQKFGWSKCGG